LNIFYQKNKAHIYDLIRRWRCE